ncbi:MAG: MFS transporter [Proteobacteria bacterium]|nr:MFS transporter [Pseudomonadota bacterium]
MAQQSEFARGWPVVLAAAVGVGLGITGIPIYAIGQFVRPLEQEFGWSRAAVAGGLSVVTACSVLMAPLIGVLVERFGARRVTLVSVPGLAAGFAGLALNGGSLGAWYLGWAALAVLGAGTSPIVWTSAVASWFERNRGLALGIALCGTGLVAVFAPGLVGGIVAARGWRAGFAALAAVQIVVALPVVLALFRVRPPSGPSGAEATARARPGLTMRQAAGSARFWRLLLAFFLMSMVVGGMIVNLPAMLADRGIDRAEAARALGLLGIAIIAGRLTVGLLVDRLPARFVAAAYVVLPAATCLLLAGQGGAAPAIFLMGLATGAEVDLLAYLVSRYFGLAHYARIYSWTLAAFSAGVGIGPPLAAWTHDATGGYQPALLAFAALAALSALLVATLGAPPAEFAPLPQGGVRPGQ